MSRSLNETEGNLTACECIPILHHDVGIEVISLNNFPVVTDADDSLGVGSQ